MDRAPCCSAAETDRQVMPIRRRAMVIEAKLVPLNTIAV
jgi:hypothetical protein